MTPLLNCPTATLPLRHISRIIITTLDILANQRELG